MQRFIIRLDDASDYMDVSKWKNVEEILDRYNVKPIFGIIPDNKDPSLINKYVKNEEFWTLVDCWIKKGWQPAMHGHEHLYITEDGGLNPVNMRSEFAGLPLAQQAEKIRAGYNVLVSHGIFPDVFFAPSHTFDSNTLLALKQETPIRVISDTVAWDIYKRGDFVYIPQQSGMVRWLPFKTITFCYHPNTMKTHDMLRLNGFISTHKECFHQSIKFEVDRKINLVDKLISKLYFMRR